MIATTHAASILPLLLALVAVCLIFGSVAVVFALSWDKIPWWRSTPKPSRQYKDDKEVVKMWKLHRKYPEAFPEGKVEEE
jgi:hypothetical protein